MTLFLQSLISSLAHTLVFSHSSQRTLLKIQSGQGKTLQGLSPMLRMKSTVPTLACKALCDLISGCLWEVYLAYFTADGLVWGTFLLWTQIILGFCTCGFFCLKNSTSLIFVTCSITSVRLFSHHLNSIRLFSYHLNLTELYSYLP